MSRRGRPPYPDILTPREWEVLALLRDGLSNEEIAQRLGISLAGAKYHVSEILSKLGVESREEAAAWSASGGEHRPWWMTALAPFGFVWRKASFGWLSAVLAGGVAVMIAAGIGLLVWGLVRTGGDDAAEVAEPLSRVTVIPTAPTPTARPNLPPLPTPERPFVGQPVDCPSEHATPEEAISACLEAIGYVDYEYVGSCDVAGASRMCSRWLDGASNLRAYSVDIGCADCFIWMVPKERDHGWAGTRWALCGGQGLVETEGDLIVRAMNLSPVRIDDCGFPPPPLPRPTLRIGPARLIIENEQSRVLIRGGAFYPGRGVKLVVSIKNISETTLPWTAWGGADSELIAEDGTRFPASEIGGTLPRSVPDGLPAKATFRGWLVFPIDEFGSYTLRSPGQPAVLLQLTPEHYDASRKQFLDSY